MHIRSTLMRDVEIAPVRMLNEWLPFANGLALFSGDGETGKSAMAIRIAAQATRGTCGGDLPAEPMNVGFLLSEDTEDKIKGRLQASGADEGRIQFLDGFEDSDSGENDEMIDLNKYLKLLRAHCAQQNIKLVIFDALSEFLGDIDQNQHGPVSRVLTRLNQWSEEDGVGIIGLHHAVKDNRRPSKKAAVGSAAFVNKSRVAVSFVKKGDDGPCYFHIDKINDLPGHPIYRFTMEGKTLEIGSEEMTFPVVKEVSRLENASWPQIRAVCAEKKEDAISPEEVDDVAGAMIKTLSLRGGKAYSFELLNAVRRTYNFSDSTQRRALKRAGIKGVRTHTFGCSRSVYTFRNVSDEEALRWAADNPIGPEQVLQAEV